MWCKRAAAVFLAAVMHGAPADALVAGKEAFAAGDYQEAAKLLSTINEHPQLCDASFYLGLSQYRLRQIDDAIVALQIAANCKGDSAQVGVALGQAYLEKGDHNRAALALEAALRREPNHLEALRSLSSVFLRHELNDKAIPVLERLVAADPQDAQSRADLGAAYAGTFNLAKAREQFELALKLKSDHVPALIGLSNVHIKNGEPELALELLNRALAVGGSGYELFFLRGVGHATGGRHKEAADDLQHALTLGGTDPEIHYQLSRVYRALGQDEKSKEALARFKETRARADQQAEGARQVARMMHDAKPLVERGNLSAAADLLERAAAFQVMDPQLFYRLASLYLDLQRYDDADYRIRVAIRIAPAEWTYRYLLGVIELKRGNLDAAREALELALRLNSSSADLLNALGDVAMRQRSYAAAVRYFQQALQLKPNEAAYRINLEAAQRLAR